MLLDMQMPYKNGLEVIQHVTEHINQVNADLVQAGKVQMPKFYILTAFFNRAVFEMAMKSGATDCFEKPLSMQQLKKLLSL
jgi:FixJ family two-component response regulator